MVYLQDNNTRFHFPSSNFWTNKIAIIIIIIDRYYNPFFTTLNVTIEFLIRNRHLLKMQYLYRLQILLKITMD